MSWLDDVARTNPEFVESLYRDYRRDPASVGDRWALVFGGFELARALPLDGAKGDDGADLIPDAVHSYRELGHLVADLDPLGRSPRRHPLLALEELGFTARDLDRIVDWAPFRGGERGPV